MAAFGIILAGAFFGTGWYLSNILKDGALIPDHENPDWEFIVVDKTNTHITLSPIANGAPSEDWQTHGILGLETNDSYGQLGELIAVSSDKVTRRYTSLYGEISIGTKARIDSYAFPVNPNIGLGIPFQNVLFLSPLGQFGAWYIDGHHDTWVIFVHGRGADQREALRVAPTITKLGFPSLTITYRNDNTAPPSPDGFYRYGETEWEDLHGAVNYALDHGAKRFVLIGYSMGGSIVMSFLYNSPLSNKVSGVILDSPMLNFNSTIDLGARQRGYPTFIAKLGKLFSTLRFKVNWENLDYLRKTDQLSVPILLFHGDADDVVPVADSSLLSELRPDLTQYIHTKSAGHVRSWNIDSQAYEMEITEFLLQFYP